MQGIRVKICLSLVVPNMDSSGPNMDSCFLNKNSKTSGSPSPFWAIMNGWVGMGWEVLLDRTGAECMGTFGKVANFVVGTTPLKSGYLYAGTF